MQKSSFRIRKDAGTNTTFQSQDDELKVEKLKTKYQELLHSHDNVVRECKLMKNELEVKFKHVRNVENKTMVVGWLVVSCIKLVG